jgi:outer membrane protein insertion porin family
MNKRLVSLLAATWLGISSAYAFEPFVVRDIRMEGLERIQNGTVLNYLPVAIGDKISATDSNDVIQALFKTGFFDDIQLERDQDTLVLKFKERPSIGKVTLSGNQEISEENLSAILKEQGLAEGMTFDRSLLEMLRNELERMYYSHGKYAVKIDTKVEHLPRNRVAISINIEEGYYARIKEINVVGNQKFSTANLLNQFDLTKPNYKSWVTRSDQYDKQKLGKDLEKLRTYYMDRGYLNFKILSTQVSISPDKQDIFITVNIHEGDQFKLDSFQMAGKTEIARDKLEKLIILKKGEVFSRSKVSDIVKAMTERLGEEGYAFAKVNPVPELDEKNKLVNLTIFVEPGQKVYVRRILIKGNTKTKDSVIRKNLSQLEGAPISTLKVEGSKQQLNRVGYFKEVSVETVPVPGINDQVDVVFTVEEASSGQLGGGIGYSDLDGIVFNANVSNRNVLGTGKSADLQFNRSKVYTTYSVSLNDPYYTIDGISRGVNLFYGETDLGKTTSISDYSTDAYGINLNYGIPLSVYDRFNFGYGFQSTSIKVSKSDDLPVQLQNFLNPNRDPNFNYLQSSPYYDEFTLALGWSHNSLDRYVFPENGLSQGISLSGAVPGSDLEYYRLSYYLQYYKSLGSGFVGMLAANVGYGNGYGKTLNLPFYKNFYAGGARSVRGFEESSLGPLDSAGNPYGGNFLTTGTLALILPDFIAPGSRAFRTAVFFDAGQVYFVKDRSNNPPPIGPEGLRYSAGISVTWMSPMAPLVFSLAKPLKKAETDKEKILSFTFGTIF